MSSVKSHSKTSHKSSQQSKTSQKQKHKGKHGEDGSHPTPDLNDLAPASDGGAHGRQASSSATSKQRATTPATPAARKVSTQKLTLFLILVALATLGCAAGFYVFFFRSSSPGTQLKSKPSKTKLGNFTQWAAVVDSRLCEGVPRKIFRRKGTIGDAAVAAILCLCTVTPSKCGLGGGMFAVYYNGRSKKAVAINGRETSPRNLTNKMLAAENASVIGPLAIGVPGFLAGLEQLLKVTTSSLKWGDLVADAVVYAERGFPVSEELDNDIKEHTEHILQSKDIRKFFTNKAGDLLKKNDLLVQRELAQTLRSIGTSGPRVFYTGAVSRNLVSDLAQNGCPITKEDLKSYKALQEQPFAVTLKGPYTFYAPSVPGGGTALGLVLALINYFVNGTSLEYNEKTAHYMVESIKYSFARRTGLADPHFVNIKETVAQLARKEFVDRLAAKIRDKPLKDALAYGITEIKNDKGSGQVCIMGSNGDAVAITASSSAPFGSYVVSKSTGIIMNNVIDDFYLVDLKDRFGNLETPNNGIAPGKRPLSSMAPTIVTDSSGMAVVVTSSVGGGKITSSLAEVIARMLWMGSNPKEAIDAGRFHHRLVPYIVYAEETVPKPILDGLRKRKHTVQVLRVWKNSVLALLRSGVRIYAGYDFRRHTDGGVDGGDGKGY